MDLKRLAPARCLCVHKYLCTSCSIEECCINQNVAVLLRVGLLLGIQGRHHYLLCSAELFFVSVQSLSLVLEVLKC